MPNPPKQKYLQTGMPEAEKPFVLTTECEDSGVRDCATGQMTLTLKAQHALTVRKNRF